jgi:hypothetical protein
MPHVEGRVRWPDGWSGSVPLPGGRIGGTYYLNPGSPSVPRLTLTRSLGMSGAGLNAVFLRQGMTSSDTARAGSRWTARSPSGLSAKQPCVFPLIANGMPTHGHRLGAVRDLCRIYAEATRRCIVDRCAWGMYSWLVHAERRSAAFDLQLSRPARKEKRPWCSPTLLPLQTEYP